MSVVSDRLRELRGPTSQSEMARTLGIVRQQWIKYETGQSAPGADILARICRVHACSADWLLGLKERGTSAAPGDSPDCKACPHMAKLRKLEEIMGK